MNSENKSNDNFEDLEDYNEDELLDLLDSIDYNKNKIDTETENNDKTFCKNCDTGDHINEDTTHGIVVCTNCGSIISELYDETPEWKQYVGDDGKETVGRCSNPTNFFLPQSSLGTNISGSSRCKLKILHNWSTMPYKERSLNIVLKEIQNKCREGGIVKCIEDDAKILYKIISESKHAYGKNKGKNIIIRGSNRTSLIAACIFFACKRKGITRSPKEIAELFGLKYKDITKGCKMFLKFIKMHKLQYDIKISNPEDFINRYCRKLHINNEYIAQTMQIAKNIQKLNIASMHTPESIATGSILLIIDINKLNIDKKQISSSFNVSEVTIIKTFKKIEQYKAILVNDNLTEKLVKILEEEKKTIQKPEKLKLMYNSINKQPSTDEVIDHIEDEIDPNENHKINEVCKTKFIDFKGSFDEYIDYINVELYDHLSESEEKYKGLVNIQ